MSVDLYWSQVITPAILAVFTCGANFRSSLDNHPYKPEMLRRVCLPVVRLALLAAGVGAFVGPHCASPALQPLGSARAAARTLFRSTPAAPLIPSNPKIPPARRAGALRSLSSNAGQASRVLPTEESLQGIPVLEHVALAAKRAVEESTGEGTESSGKGRYEWGRHPAKCQLVPLHVYTYTHPHRCDELDFKRTA